MLDSWDSSSVYGSVVNLEGGGEGMSGGGYMGAGALGHMAVYDTLEAGVAPTAHNPHPPPLDQLLGATPRAIRSSSGPHTPLLQATSSLTNISSAPMSRPPREALLVQPRLQRVEGGHQHVQPQVELVAAHQQRVGQVAGGAGQEGKGAELRGSESGVEAEERAS